MKILLHRDADRLHEDWMSNDSKPRPCFFMARAAIDAKRSLALGEYTPVATFKHADGLEDIWLLTQNKNISWSEDIDLLVREGVTIFPTDGRRSTSVDDIIYDDVTGKFHYCASIGWEEMV